MSVPQAPRVATWLLQHLGADNAPLAGDLLPLDLFGCEQ